MEKIIERLWYSYLMEHSVECNEERKRIVEMLASESEKIRKGMDEDERAALNIYEMHMNTLSEIAEKEAFARGIRFATQYMLDVLYGK